MYNQQNILAKIIKNQLPAKKIFEDDYLIAIEDINPAAPVHILIIPKGEYIDYEDFTNNASNQEIIHYFQTISKIATMLNLSKDGYRLVSNKGIFGGQVIFHFHTHLLGGEILNKEMI